MKEAERKELERDVQRDLVISTNLRRRAEAAGNGNPPLVEVTYDIRENPYRGKYALDKDGMQIFRKKIKDGTIDIGPMPDHSGPIVDRRPKP